MKDKIRAYIAGLLTAAIVAGTTLAVAGEQIKKTVDVYYNGIKICIDGSYIEPKDANGNTVEPFIMDGTTYLPVRAVGNAFGKDVAWDGDTQTVFLGAKPGENKYSRTNPAPVGTPQTINISTYSEKYTATVTVNEVIKGEAATQKALNDNMFNDPPKEGYEYYIVKVAVNVANVANDQSVSLGSSDFTFYSTDYSEYDNLCFVTLENRFSGSAYSGGTVEGYICQEIRKEDATPSIVFGQDYDGKGGIWFSLTK